jgi:hypothetical protein
MNPRPRQGPSPGRWSEPGADDAAVTRAHSEVAVAERLVSRLRDPPGNPTGSHEEG